MFGSPTAAYGHNQDQLDDSNEEDSCFDYSADQSEMDIERGIYMPNQAVLLKNNNKKNGKAHMRKATSRLRSACDDAETPAYIDEAHSVSFSEKDFFLDESDRSALARKML